MRVDGVTALHDFTVKPGRVAAAPARQRATCRPTPVPDDDGPMRWILVEAAVPHNRTAPGSSAGWLG